MGFSSAGSKRSLWRSLLLDTSRIKWDSIDHGRNDLAILEAESSTANEQGYPRTVVISRKGQVERIDNDAMRRQSSNEHPES